MLQRILSAQSMAMLRFHQPDRWGWTMLHHAANNGQQKTVEWLLANYARPHQLSFSKKKAADLCRFNETSALLRDAMFKRAGLAFDGEFSKLKISYV